MVRVSNRIALKPRNMAEIAVAASLAFFLGGCSLLPEGKETVESPWRSFADAKATYDKIEPGRTTLAQLKKLGIDPYTTSNVSVLSYLDIIQRFIPNNAIKYDQLAPPVRDCIDARETCWGYEVSPKEIHSKRTGNVLADVFSFRRKTIRKGWSFNALIIFKDNGVVYKIWRGKPLIREQSTQKSPLGPLQNSGDLLRSQIITD